jgi:hypothetical protein
MDGYSNEARPQTGGKCYFQIALTCGYFRILASPETTGAPGAKAVATMIRSAGSL